MMEVDKGPESRYAKPPTYKPFKMTSPKRHHDGSVISGMVAKHIIDETEEVRLFKLRPEMDSPDLGALVYDLNLDEYTKDHQKQCDKPLHDWNNHLE